MRPYNPEERIIGALPFGIILGTIILFVFEKQWTNLIDSNQYNGIGFIWWMAVGLGYPIICIFFSWLIAKIPSKDFGSK